MTAEKALTATSESAHGDLKSRRTPRMRADLHVSSMASARTSSIPAKRRSQVYAERGGREQSWREGESQKRQGQDDEEGGAQIFFEACFLLLRC